MLRYFLACWVLESATARDPCSGKRHSQDAVVWLGQARHSSYDSTHKNTLNASMLSVATFYPFIGAADVLVWHEGDLSARDADALSGKTNARPASGVACDDANRPGR